jgi:cobalamin biosynthesis protein CobC
MPAPRPPLPAHGGDLAAAEARWGRPDRGWLDLSTGINPHPFPVPAIPAHSWTRLPGADDEAALRAAAARCYGAASPHMVLAVPGSGAAIRMLPRLRPACRVAVVGPTYGEHAAAWAAAGHDVHRVASVEDVGDAAVVVVVNPNNPDGRLEAPARLAALSARLVIVDEAFGDTVPQASVIPLLRPGMMVLRSFGKFYGLAGMRLGFAIASPDLLQPLAEALGPWPVSGPALAAGTQALADGDWAMRNRIALGHDAARLDHVLSAAGLDVIGGTSLFRFARHPRAHALWDQLGQAGILVRAFADRPTKLRFGLPGSEGGMERLRQALAG